MNKINEFLRRNNYIKLMLLLMFFLLFPLLIEKFVFPNEPINLIRFTFEIIFFETIALTMYFGKKKSFDFINKYKVKIRKKFKSLKQFISSFFTNIINNNTISLCFLPKNIFLTVVFIFLIIVGCYNLTKKDVTVFQNDENKYPSTAILEKTSFNISNDISSINADRICFWIGTYSRTNAAEYKISLADDNNVYTSRILNTEKLVDNALYCVSIPKIENSNNLKLVVDPIKADSSNSIAIYNNDKHLSYVLLKSRIFNINFVIIALAIGFFCLFINYLINKRHVKIETLFLLLFPYFLIMTFIFPPFQVPDEPYHFFKAYSIAESSNIFYLSNNINLPQNYNCLDYSKFSIFDYVQDVDSIKQCNISSENISKNLSDYNFSDSSLLGYVFTSIAIKLIDFFTNNPLIIFFFGRLFNMCVAFFILYKSIKITPKYKFLFLSLATMPMFLQQTCSYNYDSTLNAFLLLFCAICIKFISEKEVISFKYYLLLFVSILFITNIKMVYVPIFALLFLIPKSCFSNSDRKKILNIIILLLSAMAFAFLLNLFFKTNSFTSSNGQYGIMLFIKNPFGFLIKIFNTFLLLWNFYLKGLFGYFGWFKYPIDDIFLCFYIFYFILLLFYDNDLIKSKLRKSILLLSIFACTILIFLAMYILSTPVDYPYVLGVQGRYFIPVLLPLFLLLSFKKESIKLDSNIPKYIVNFICFMTIIYICGLYY
jgi:uncharacterized membrane protein